MELERIVQERGHPIAVTAITSGRANTGRQACDIQFPPVAKFREAPRSPRSPSHGSRRSSPLQTGATGRGDAETLSSRALVNLPEPGVTKAQVWESLGVMVQQVKSESPGLGGSAEFSGAVVRLSEKVKAVQGGIGIGGEGGALRERFQYRGVNYRIDLENIIGHNLKE